MAANTDRDAGARGRSGGLADLDDPFASPLVAHLADADHGADDDVAWVASLAARAAGPVADLGCGAGRLTLPLAAAGVPVLAVDRSPAMLAALRRRIATAPAAARFTQVVEADLAAWSSEPESLALAILGYNTLAALLTAEDQRRLFTTVLAALRPGGVLAVATAAIGARLALLPEGLSRQVYRRSAPELGPGVEVTRTVVHRWTDETLQIRRLAAIYDVREADGGRRREQFEYAARYSTRWELEHLLAGCGFTAITANGGYAGERFTVEGGLLVMTAQRSGAPPGRQ